METDRLKQFCAVVETGSLSRASEILGITLSGLSRSMTILQDQLKRTLFRPEGRGITITDEGLLVFRQAQEILTQISSLEDQSLRVKKSFRVGALEVFSYNLIGQILHRSGVISGEIVELDPKALEANILDRRLECGLTYLPFAMEGVEHLKIVSFEMGAFARADLLKLDKYQDIPFIVPARGFDINPIGIKERDGWPEKLWERKVSFRANSLATGINLASIGFGAIFVPVFLIDIFNKNVIPEMKLSQIRISRKQIDFKRYVFLAKRVSSEESSEMKALAAGLRKVLNRT